MRVLIINTSERTGGAAVAASRLLDALNANGVKAKMLVRDKETDKLMVVGLKGGLRQRWKFLWERWTIFCHLHFSRHHLFDIDTASAGTDITRLPEFREADIIHLHWVNQGMLSLRGIRKILRSGKPVVWTMHDIWPATAICHLTLGCRRFTSTCQRCRYLPHHGSTNDLATKIWKRKKNAFSSGNIHFVACSRWLADEAKKSSLLQGLPVTNIPNPISTRIYHVTDKNEARQRLGLPSDRRLILFVSQRVTNPYKGMTYLVEACRKIVSEQPQLLNDTALVVLGGHSEELAHEFALPVYPLGYVNDTSRIVDIYNAVDVFVLPSLSENLPNTIMEAMACGVPCVGFKVGGIPEMIDHRKNGYVAAYKNSDDLASGLQWVLDEADYSELSRQAVSKVMKEYSGQSVVMEYTEVYNEALALKNFIR